MIIDSSALIALLRDEPDAKELVMKMLTAETPLRLSAASYVEVGAVIDSQRDPILSRRMDEAIRALGIQLEPVSIAQATIAREAYRDFGKGSGHKAALNFGDCLSYALAKEMGEPLLFKGDDFSHTDLAQN